MLPVDRKHLSFKHPFTCITAGPTSSGKTVLIRRILENHKSLIFFKNDSIDILKVIWAYGQWQTLYEAQIPSVDIRYLEGLPSEEEILSDKPHLVIIDDLMSELGSDKKLTNLFTKGSHHHDISIVFISQNIFYQGSQMRTISLNCHYMLLMKNPRDKAQIIALASQIYPNNSKFLIEAFNDATKNEFGYIKVDMKQDTPDNLRIQSRITPEEKPTNCEYSISPIAYTPK
jgi:molybdopterin-guanine dinucleotide biosynthesis protein